ncbi:MAG: hypothetical protein RLZZ182_2028, partial [Pseudomonadota bacterium]
MTQHTELIERLRAFSELSGFATAGWDLPASATSVLSKLCDGSHGAGVLAAAAASYAIAASRVLCGQHDNFVPPAIWPWHIDWWKPRDARSNLV